MSRPFVKTVGAGSWGPCGEPSVTLFDDAASFRKAASDTTIFGCGYDQLRPDKDHVGIHLVALGDFEHYGLNRNFDGFSKASCVKYHPTFVKNGFVFEHHINKDPKKALGNIIKSAYSEKMGRVELMIHAHREKAAEHLKTYEDTGTVSFSMACTIPFDVCTKCARHRLNRHDTNACEHLKYEFGKTASDGTVIGTLNPDPNWFDISFVRRPADRIAWDLKKVAGLDDEHAEAEAPDRIAISSDLAKAKLSVLKKLAEFTEFFTGKGPAPGNRIAYYNTVKVAGVSDIPDTVIEELRRFSPSQVFSKLAEAGVVLGPDQFFRYVFGNDYGDVRHSVKAACGYVPSIIVGSVKSENCSDICNNDRYNVDSSASPLPVFLTKKLAELSSVTGPDMQHRAIYGDSSRLSKTVVDKYAGVVFNSDHSRILAEEYVAYKVAAVQAVVDSARSLTDTDSVYAVAASQNLVV